MLTSKVKVLSFPKAENMTESQLQEDPQTHTTFITSRVRAKSENKGFFFFFSQYDRSSEILAFGNEVSLGFIVSSRPALATSMQSHFNFSPSIHYHGKKNQQGLKICQAG
jgi:hypothetical protein